MLSALLRLLLLYIVAFTPCRIQWWLNKGGKITWRA
jgi:hypothetical protein